MYFDRCLHSLINQSFLSMWVTVTMKSTGEITSKYLMIKFKQEIDYYSPIL